MAFKQLGGNPAPFDLVSTHAGLFRVLGPPAPAHAIRTREAYHSSSGIAAPLF